MLVFKKKEQLFPYGIVNLKYVLGPGSNPSGVTARNARLNWVFRNKSVSDVSSLIEVNEKHLKKSK